MPTILVIDDEEEIRSVVKHHLVKANYKVIEAANGEEAIEKINEGDNPLTIDAAICDIRMPKINGVEAISYFRKEYPSVPIIVVTGFPDATLAVSLMKKGVKDYIVKPVEKEKLLAAVKKVVSERSQSGGGAMA
jgi:two-component system chemotaxis response regulator CheY